MNEWYFPNSFFYLKSSRVVSLTEPLWSLSGDLRVPEPDGSWPSVGGLILPPGPGRPHGTLRIGQLRG